MSCSVLPWNQCIDMHARIANTCIETHGSVAYFREICALKYMVELQRNVSEIQGRVTYCRSISALTYMGASQTNALTCNAVLHTPVQEVHWPACPNCKCMQWNARPCYRLPWNARIDMHDEMQIHALICKAVSRTSVQVVHLEYQIHALKCKAVLRRSVQCVHWYAWSNCKHIHWNARPCYALLWHK